MATKKLSKQQEIDLLKKSIAELMVGMDIQAIKLKYTYLKKNKGRKLEVNYN